MLFHDKFHQMEHEIQEGGAGEMKDGEKISKIIYFLNIKLIEKIYSFSIDFENVKRI